MAPTQISKKRYGALLVLPALVLTQLACSTDQLPNDTQLNISPATHSIDIVEQRNADDRCIINPDNYVDLPLVVELTSGDGSPIGDAAVSVYLDFAGNTYSGFPALALYEDRNGNGVVDADTELVSGSEDDIAVVTTGQYDGSYRLLIRVNVSCPYRGGVYAIAGGTVSRSSISVNAIENGSSADNSTAADAVRFVSGSART